MHRDNNDSGWINWQWEIECVDRFQDIRQERSDWIIRFLRDRARIHKKYLAYVKTLVSRKRWPFFLNPSSSRFLTFITGHHTSRRKGTKSEVRRLLNIPIYLEGWPAETGPLVIRSPCYSASLIGSFDIRRLLPAKDRIILWRRSRYCTLCTLRFALLLDSVIRLSMIIIIDFAIILV